MERSPRKLAAFVSSVISEVVLLLMLLLFSSSPPIPNPTSTNILPLLFNHLLSCPVSSSSSPFPTLSIQLHHLLATASSIISLISDHSPPSRKRKRELLQSESSSSSPSSIQLPDASSPFPILALPKDDPDTFKACFRMTSTTFEWLSGLLEPLLECRDPHGSSLNLSSDVRLAIGLFRLATGSPYQDIACRFRVSESTSRFCTKQLCRVLCTNFRFWVAFPTELQDVSAAFEASTGLPNCCGVVYCTRFNTESGGSIAMQIVVDSTSKILSIATGFRGDKGDFMVLKSSALYKDTEGGQLLNGPRVKLNGVDVPQYLVGNGVSYPLLPWLMLPFVQFPITTAKANIQLETEEEERAFNAALQSIRNPAFRTISSLRSWGVLNQPTIEEDVSMAVASIAACSILHNVLLMREDYSALLPDLPDGTQGDNYTSTSSSYNHGDCVSSLEEEDVDKKAMAASVIRNALAARAKEFHVSASTPTLNKSGNSI